MFYLAPLLIFLTACSQQESSQEEPYLPNGELESEPLNPKNKNSPPLLPPLIKAPLPHYPWSDDLIGGYPRISKWFFQCRGNSLNPPRETRDQEEHIIKLFDCNGSADHGLPLFDGKESIYPVLIELLNWLQKTTEGRVVITCGHRCPAHNIWADETREARHSKHLIGGEVDFYVEGYEEEPQKIVDLIFSYYQDHFPSDKAYTEFHRYTKSDTNVSIPPWYNKEIFIKLFKNGEGRDADNRHPYPYVSLQVRFDRDKNERVTFTYDQAYQGFLQK